MERDYYKVLIAGRSGTGKTYSFRNMDIKTTGFINIENKPLPYKNLYKYHSRPTTLQQIKDALHACATTPDIEVIIIDSFSAFVDILLAEARASKRGFDIWSFYAEEVGKFLSSIKKINKELFITAHYEWLQGEEGVKEKRVKVKGKEWEGLIEKEFTLVVYTDVKVNDKGMPEYNFSLFQENSSTKCPPGIFGEGVVTIPNDVKFMYNKIIEFAKI